MTKDLEKSLGEEKTRGEKERGAAEDTSRKSLGDSQTLIGGLAADDGTLEDGLELTDLSARYTIVETLGQGGMREVLLATDNRLKRQVAIKRIRGEQARSRTAVKRFLTEAQAIAALNHPNIVQVYDYGRDQEGPFLIMEYVDGQSLLERCKDSPLPLEEAVELTCELLGGLGRAHELGIIHRDIKPANILLTKDGRPKLTDFGLAKQTTADHGQTVTGAVLGTIDFMPPEQRRNSTLVDARSDLWSLAASLYQMLTGKSPKVILLDQLPNQLAPVLGKALEENPAERFQSAAEFRDVLRKAMQVTELSFTDELTAGQCPQCGTRNSDSVRFCKECSTPLKVPCLSCEAEIPIWDKGCTECGARQAELLVSKRAELQTLQAEVERTREAGQLGVALQQLESLGGLKHPRLGDYRQWAERLAGDLRDQTSRLNELAASAVSEARAHRAAWDYSAAVRVLKALPPEASGGEQQLLLEQLQSEWSESKQLLLNINQQVKARKLDGLLPLVRRAVELRGDRQDLQKLLGQLEEREARKVAPPAVVVDPLSESFDLPSESVTLPVVLGKQSARMATSWQRSPIALVGIAAATLLLVIGVWLAGRAGEKTALLTGSSQNVNDEKAAEVKSSNPERPQTSTSPAAMTSVDKRKGVPSSAKASSTPAGERPSGNSDEITNSLGMRLKLIPAGKFLMGSPASENGRQSDERLHDVTLTRPFYVGVYEVTQEQYEKVIERNPS